MRMQTSVWVGFGGAVCAVVGISCGSADEHPLGGPFGGPTSTASTTNDGGPPGDGGNNVADAGGQGTDSGGVLPKDGGGPPPKDTGTMTAGPTWTSIYAADFGPGTPGRCGDGGCHASTKRGFRCNSKDDCYNYFVSSGYVSGTSSALTGSSSCLWWFSSVGNMPTDNGTPGQTELDNIKAWVQAGAANN